LCGVVLAGIFEMIPNPFKVTKIISVRLFRMDVVSVGLFVFEFAKAFNDAAPVSMTVK
jgi:hypothetical protein